MRKYIGIRDEFLLAVKIEVGRTMVLHPATLQTPHEAYAVMLEELEEFWAEVKKKRHSKSDMKNELIQLAAMACRTVEDLGL